MLAKYYLTFFFQIVFISFIHSQNIEKDTINIKNQEFIDAIIATDIKAQIGKWAIGLSSQLNVTSLLNIYDYVLIVINDIPFNQVSSEDFDFATADERDYANLIGLSLNDIVDFRIEDNPVSASMYGKYAKGGVLYINTVDNVRRSFVVNYSYKNTIGRRQKNYEMLSRDEYSTEVIESYMNTYRKPMNEDLYKEFSYFEPYYYYNYGANTDWYNEINKQTSTKDHYLSVKGRGSMMGYRFSAGYIDEKGSLEANHLKQINSRLGLDCKFNNLMKLNFDLDFMNTNHNDFFYANDDMSLYELAYKKMPNMSVYEYDIEGDLTGNYLNASNNLQGISYYNPVMMLEQSKENKNANRITSSISLQVNLSEKLSYLLQGSYQLNNSETKSDRLQNFSDTQLEYTINQTIDDDRSNLYLNNVLSYQIINSDEHQFKGVIQHNFSKHKIDIESNYQNSTSLNEYVQRDQIFLGGIHYLLLKKYQIDLSLRSEYLKINEKLYNATLDPAVSLKWILGEEGLFKKMSFINYLALGCNYGKYTVNNYSLIDDFTKEYIQKDLNFNSILFKERLKLYFRYYNYLSPNHYNLSGSYLEPEIVKYGLVNYGWDFNLNTKLLQTNNFQFDFHLNLYSNKQKIVDLASDAIIKYEANTNGIYQKQLINNTTFGDINGYIYNGVYQYSEFIPGIQQNAPIAKDANGNPLTDDEGNYIVLSSFNGYQFQGGDAKYADINYDGIIDENDVVNIGNASPKLTGSGGPSISYKRWWLGIYFDFRVGNDVVNMTRMSLENMYGFDNQIVVTTDRWRNEGDLTNVPRALMNNGYNWLGSTRFVENGSYLRLKGITLKHDFSKNLTNKLHLDHLSFFVSARNVFTQTNYKGPDPAISLSTDWLNYGFDYNYLSPLQEFTFGIDIGI